MDLRAEATTLVEQLARACNKGELFGSTSVAVYDTAWVSMVSKDIDGQRHWIFQQCFQFILDHQLPDGGWEEYASEVDGVPNTMAGLLTLLWHRKDMTPRGGLYPVDLDSRILKAEMFLSGKLQRWDVAASDHVGFEILVPALLELLGGEGVHFCFPGLELLRFLNRKKLLKFDARVLYAYPPAQTTLVHSLEAFVGKLDYDKICHHKVFGSIIASPSSTAAYLIYTSVWDDDAEAYLRNVIQHGQRKGSGGLPSAFPICIFEATWVWS